MRGGVERGGGGHVLSCPGSPRGRGYWPGPGVPGVPQPVLALAAVPLCVLDGSVGSLKHKHGFEVRLNICSVILSKLVLGPIVGLPFREHASAAASRALRPNIT